MPNNVCFEMTVPRGSYGRADMKDKTRVAPDGYVYAPAKPGLGSGIDRDALERMTKRIDRQRAGFPYFLRWQPLQDATVAAGAVPSRSSMVR